MKQEQSMREAARRLASELPLRGLVNLGRGLPTLTADYLPQESNIQFQSENGVIGVGASAPCDNLDYSLTDASKRPITLAPGASVFDLGASFDMIRGGRIDIAILGAFEVSEEGDLANYASNDGNLPPAVGGAMDLAVGAKRVWVITRHLSKSGRPKIVPRCTLPLTAPGVVERIYTDVATFSVIKDRGLLVEWISPNYSREDVSNVTPARHAFELVDL